MENKNKLKRLFKKNLENLAGTVKNTINPKEERLKEIYNSVGIHKIDYFPIWDWLHIYFKDGTNFDFKINQSTNGNCFSCDYRIPVYTNEEGTEYNLEDTIGAIGYLVSENFKKVIRTEEKFRQIYSREIEHLYSHVNEGKNKESKKQITKQELVEDFYKKLSQVESLFEQGDKN